jgi:pantoate--beta-alanine ligase
VKVVTRAAELAAVGGTRGVVMTMGALHEGHLELVRAATRACDEVIVTIFVNPLQFNDPADLERYPRTLEADLALLAPLGVDAVFAPSADEVYPAGSPIVTVSAGAIGEILEGEHRPGHFDGVLTVVLKLLNLTRPDMAFFGEKDAQQLIAVRRMVADLNVGADVRGVPTVRDPDGLALSSRNVFLSPAQREEALVLSRALTAAAGEYVGGGSLDEALATGRALLAEVPSVAVDYFAALDPASALPATGGEVIFAVAARVGDVRLIDNVRARRA